MEENGTIKENESAQKLATAIIDVNTYQGLAATTAIYQGKGELQGLTYVTLGLAGEAGEIANKVKKLIRGDGELTQEKREAIAAELGDVMWYASQLCEELEVDLADVLQNNLNKLFDRKDRGTIKGDGDIR